MQVTSKYTQLIGVKILDHDNASSIIIPDPKQDLYLYVEKIVLSVYEAAVGGEGVLEILDTEGVPFWRINVDGVKDFELDFGSKGKKISTATDIGVQAMLSGANTQASVSIAIMAHLDVD